MDESRERTWEALHTPWDIVVSGGGITGAGIFREATRLGLRTLLLEQRDVAGGASSRSGKLVHGGLRYLRQGQFRLTWHAARERERLLRDTPGLVADLGFLLPVYSAPQRLLLALGLTIYDLMAVAWHHRYLDRSAFELLAPHVRKQGLHGGFWYLEAQTDDARLVLRLIREGVRAGGMALNYAAVEGVCRLRTGRVTGVIVRDRLADRTAEVQARVVINATGPWADGLRAQVGGRPRLRLLRGSHLLFPAWRFPLAQAVGFWHPVDRRPLYAFPWEGVTLVGTTDVDHSRDLGAEPRITPAEVDYLLEALRHQFPYLDLAESDVLATFAGVRPVVGTGKQPPSREPREHVVWEEEGLLTVTGGKLTTFRILAHDALRRARRRLDLPRRVSRRAPLLGTPVVDLPGDLDRDARLRLLGRYGAEAQELVAAANPEELTPISGTPFLWAELRWAATREAVVHLDDLLLRRVRLGLLLPQGGLSLMDRIRVVVRPALEWDDRRWEAEVRRYAEIWREAYGVRTTADR